MFKYFFLLLVGVSTILAQCDEGEVECPDGDCIPPSWICDGTADCAGGWDETPPCPTTTIPPCDGFLCNDGQCIISSWECDNYCDCSECEDEHDGCEDLPCDGFECDDGQCIPGSWICDGWEDCSGGEDEAEPCPTPGPCDGFQCNNGVCIIDSWVCDGYNDCPDGEDEWDCPCEGDEIKCPGGIGCIPEEFLCDTVADCPDGSDEENCNLKKNLTISQRSKLIAKHKKFQLKKLKPRQVERKQQIKIRNAKLPERKCKNYKRIFNL